MGDARDDSVLRRLRDFVRRSGARAAPTASRRRPSFAPVLASVATFALEGVDSREVTVEVDVRQRPARVHPRRPARRGRAERRASGSAPATELGPRLPARSGSRRTSHPRIVRKAGRGSTWLSRSASWSRAVRCPAEALAGTAVCGELSLERRAAPRRRRARRGAGRPGGAGFARLIVPAANAAEAALVGRASTCSASHRSLGSSTSCTVAGALRPRVARGRPDRPRAPGPTSPTCAGSRTRAARWRSPRRGAQPADGRAARRGQDDGRPAAPGHPAAAVVRRGAGDHAHPQRRRHRLKEALARRRPFRAPASHDLAAGAGRRRREAASGRDHARAPRRPVPRRAGRVLAAAPWRRSASRSRMGAWRSSAVSGRSRSLRARLSSAPATRAPARVRPEQCTCDEIDRLRYGRRLSGPLLDRIDLVCQVASPSAAELVEPGAGRGERSAAIRARVVAGARASA